MSRDEIRKKYGMTIAEAKEIFSHPKLKGIRIKRQRVMRIQLIDDTAPQQMTLHQGIAQDQIQTGQPRRKRRLMAIASNDSRRTSWRRGHTPILWHCTMFVIAVNPTLGELHALGINIKSEPNYTGIQMGDKHQEQVCVLGSQQTPRLHYSLRHLG